MITATSTEEISGAMHELLLREIPQTDAAFDIDDVLRDYKKVVFSSDGVECGVLVYLVVGSIFFISILAADAKTAPNCGDEIYLWIEREAKKLGCKYVQFESSRRAMLRHAVKYHWRIVNVKYQKELF